MPPKTKLIDKETAKKEISILVNNYNKLLNSKKLGSYNEQETKAEYIEPLFEYLGWDVRNKLLKNEVSREENVSKKRVDYGFKINGIPKFYLEAKSFKEDLYNPKYIEQAINYSWLKGCVWAVLTNFETIIIFNAEWKTDSLLQSRFRTIPCTEFLNRFDELWLLSKEAFIQDLINKEAERLGKKTAKTRVDKQLLNDFTRYREILSKNINKLNQSKNLTEENLDEAIQRILDRLIFIRNCEDREIEPRILLSNYREWENRGKGQLIKNLRDIFTQFDKDYDSEIFSKHISDEVNIDNEIIHEIIEGLYYTKDKSFSYDFSVIDADVLGNVYEQYLSHVLNKTAKRATLVESKNVRKEQGIFYTPAYITDYIVRNTLGELLKVKNVDVDKIKILDAASGSGSFLIKSFDVIDEYYKRIDKNYAQAQIDEGGTFTKKVKILKNNIFGVDLDKQAVQIAQLNLLLKIAQRKHRLPLLQKNIRCGNSLISDENVAGNKRFIWGEQFSDILEKGGFDIVIGNPPYIRNTDLPDNDKNYYNETYSSAYQQYDIFILFFEKGIELLKNNGYLGFITSNKFLASDYGQKLRSIILEKCKIVSLIDVSNIRIFKDASTYPVITILQKENDIEKVRNNIVAFKKVNDIGELFENINEVKIKQSELTDKDDNRFLSIKGSSPAKSLIKKIENNSKRIKELFEYQRGSPKNKITIVNQFNNKSKKCIISKNVNQYSSIISKDIFIISNLQDKIYSKEKILMPRTVLNLKATYEKGNNFIMDRIYYLILKENVTINLKYVTAILNSKVIDFYYKQNFGTTHVGGNYLDLRGVQIAELPIKIPPESQKNEVVILVEKMLKLKENLNDLGDIKIDERKTIEEEVNTINYKLNDIIYKIYGITNAEKALIEESFGIKE